MKIASTGRVIIPKIFYNGRWYFIAEKVRKDGSWIKIQYGSICIMVEAMLQVAVSDRIAIKVLVNNNIIA